MFSITDLVKFSLDNVSFAVLELTKKFSTFGFFKIQTYCGSDWQWLMIGALNLHLLNKEKKIGTLQSVWLIPR